MSSPHLSGHCLHKKAPMLLAQPVGGSPNDHEHSASKPCWRRRKRQKPQTSNGSSYNRRPLFWIFPPQDVMEVPLIIRKPNCPIHVAHVDRQQEFDRLNRSRTSSSEGFNSGSNEQMVIERSAQLRLRRCIEHHTQLAGGTVFFVDSVHG